MPKPKRRRFKQVITGWINTDWYPVVHHDVYLKRCSGTRTDLSIYSVRDPNKPDCLSERKVRVTIEEVE